LATARRLGARRHVGDAHDAVVVVICAAVPLTVNTSGFRSAAAASIGSPVAG